MTSMSRWLEMVEPEIATTPVGLMNDASGTMLVTGSSTPWFSGMGISAWASEQGDLLTGEFRTYG
jgi:hypothetical protein